MVLEKSFAHDLQQLQEQIREEPPKCSLLCAPSLFPGHLPFSSFYWENQALALGSNKLTL